MARITGLYITCIARANDVYYEGVRFVDTTTEFWDLTYPTPITCSLLIFLQKEWSGKKFLKNFSNIFEHVKNFLNILKIF